MAQLNGSEFDNQTGTQGSLLKFIWKKIYLYFSGVYNDAKTYVDTALGNVYTKTETDNLLAPIAANVTTLQGGLAAELVARANGDTVLANTLNSLTAQVVGLKTITPWDASGAFPTVRSDGQAFSKGNYVQVTVSNGIYKAGDMLICTTDGATTVASFGDIDSNVDIATDVVYGTVKLVASLAEYNGDNDLPTGSKVISKAVLQAILGEVTAAITTAYQSSDAALQTAITTAYQAAISTALGNVYTKTEVDAFLSTINGNVASLSASVAALTTALADKVSKAKATALGSSIKAAIIALSEGIQNAKVTYDMFVLGNQNTVTGTNGVFSTQKKRLQWGQRWDIRGISLSTGLNLCIARFNAGGVYNSYTEALQYCPSYLKTVRVPDAIVTHKNINTDPATGLINYEVKLFFNPDLGLTDTEIMQCNVFVQYGQNDFGMHDNSSAVTNIGTLLANIDTAVAGL